MVRRGKVRESVDAAGNPCQATDRDVVPQHLVGEADIVGRPSCRKYPALAAALSYSASQSGTASDGPRLGMHKSINDFYFCAGIHVGPHTLWRYSSGVFIKRSQELAAGTLVRLGLTPARSPRTLRARLGCVGRGGVALWLVVACGPRVASDSAGETATSGIVIDSTEATTSTDRDSVSGSAGSGTREASDSGQETGSLGSSSSAGDEVPRGCDWGDAVIAVARGVTPDGEVALVDGAFGYDLCNAYPYLELYGDPEHREAPSELSFLVDWREGGGAPFAGTWSMSQHGAGPGGGVAEIRFLEPLPRSATRLWAVLTVTGEGWDFEAEVEVPYCDAVSTCGCPCE